ncbi:carboxypeptidase regulatory-like domain-containing protein [Candidatus Zixiibacteriota bacterium]
MNPFRNRQSARYALLVAAFLALTSLAVLALPATILAQGRTGDIEGTVIDSESGEPLMGVIVSLHDANGRPTMIGAYTDADGKYAIPNVPPGQFQLRTRLPHYSAVTIEEVIITVGYTTEKHFQLEKAPPTGVIRGKVTDRVTGEPIAAANIFVLELDGTATRQGAFSNADGEYVIINVPEGRYLLRAVMLKYKTVEVEELLVIAGTTTQQHFQLEPTGTGTDFKLSKGY